jgi:hypothetical protein
MREGERGRERGERRGYAQVQAAQEGEEVTKVKETSR